MDASFWINLCVSQAIQFLPPYFQLYVPEVVVQEIRYPLEILGIQSMTVSLFDQWRTNSWITLRNPSANVNWFQPGENAAIALALQQNYYLLMDDANPYHRAKRAGIKVVGSSEFIVLLLDHGKLSFEEAVEALKQNHASKKQKQEAIVVLEILRRRKGA